MKMYRLKNLFVAVNEAGQFAPIGCAEPPESYVLALCTEPETFLRRSGLLLWTDDGYEDDIAGVTPLWERPDPHYTAFECETMRLVVDGYGHYAPINKDCEQADAWLYPEEFINQNAVGAVFWTSLDGGGEGEEAHYTDLINEQGRKLWEVPHG